MKCSFRIFIVLNIFYRTVNGLKSQESSSITIDAINSNSMSYFTPGVRKSISCKASSKNQVLEWVDPSGNVVTRKNDRLFTQEQFIQTSKLRIPALVLTIAQMTVADTGVWQCRSGDVSRNVTICVLDILEFVNTVTEVTVDTGRAITLVCEASGDPEPEIIWKKDGEVITDEYSSKYKLATKFKVDGFEGLLTITSLEPEDAGTYTCEGLQQSPELDDCKYNEDINITLNVNFAPIFEDGNDTKLVYGNDNENVELVCNALGYPPPKYAWFKEMGNVLYRFPPETLGFIADDDNQTKAILTVEAGPTTYGQRFKCQVTNEMGQREKSYVLLKMEKPKKPQEVTVYNSTDTMIQFNISWFEEVIFPIDEIVIQYLKNYELPKKLRVTAPREVDWKKGNVYRASLDETEEEGQFVTLPDLEPETEYWIRVKAKNGAGESSWSDATIAVTVEPLEVEEEPGEKQNIIMIERTTTYENFSDITLYAIVVGVGVVIMAAIIFCMIKLNK